MSIQGKHFYRFSYLKSDHWKSLRLEKLASTGAACCRCEHIDPSNDVHHLNYKNLWDVELMDLVVLCRPCHKKVHEVMDATREALLSGADPREEWKLFLNVWGEHPNEIVEVRRVMVEMRKRIEKKVQPPWVAKKPQSPKRWQPKKEKPSCINIPIPIPIEDFIRYKRLAAKCEMKVGQWLCAMIASHLPPELDDLPWEKPKLSKYGKEKRPPPHQ